MDVFALFLIWIVGVLFATKVAILGFKSPRKPSPGETWQWKGEANQGPWPSKQGGCVTVVDVKDGWVRYDMAFFEDCRLREDAFRRMYRHVC